jgi:8-oxo-dGTP pyrophosphatase MutT (NUDIX family)
VHERDAAHRFDRLEAFPRRELSTASSRAAVAVCLTEHDDGHVTWPLVMRASNLRVHAGQYGLPGGRAEAGESALACALREVWEELGIPARDWTRSAVLDDYESASGYVISLVVLLRNRAGSNQLTPSSELSAVYELDVTALNTPTYQTEYPGESPSSVSTICVAGHEISPPTGALLQQFRDAWFHDRVTRVHHLQAPTFAQR